MFKFTRRIERIDVYLNSARPNDSQHCESESRNVGKHEGDAVTLRDAEFGLQVRREVARQQVSLRVRQRLAEAADGWLVREPLHRALKHLQYGAIGVRVDLCWNSLTIRCEPVLVRHFLLLNYRSQKH